MSRTANSSDAPHAVVGTENHAGVRSAEERPQRLDLTRLRLLAGDHVVQPEEEQGVGVGQDAFVERGAETGLVDVR
ncbi:hypothetical protein [Streptomyces sp. GS7]|uniref:hypothetical protein n=1 Tax=Streptomyces sp. GS7 TaxID=2692234 RepID=UPI001915EDE9|nr:hypothetical protein [Streptomyces sp. GS7]